MDAQWDSDDGMTHTEYEATPLDGNGETIHAVVPNGDPMPELEPGVNYQLRVRRVTRWHTVKVTLSR